MRDLWLIDGDLVDGIDGVGTFVDSVGAMWIATGGVCTIVGVVIDATFVGSGWTFACAFGDDRVGVAVAIVVVAAAVGVLGCAGGRPTPRPRLAAAVFAPAVAPPRLVGVETIASLVLLPSPATDVAGI